jgi:soluble lytic murein transglycosylase-like protein
LRSKLLVLWYVLLLALVVELAAYILAGYMAYNCRRILWERFNDGVKQWHDADARLPYADIINRFSRQAGVSGEVVAAVIKAESSFQARAVSSAGAYGLMQVIPGTWRQVNRELNVCAGRHAGDCTTECYFTPELNIHIGSAYLGQLYKKYRGDMVLALAAYNAGPAEVDRLNGVPSYRETNDYIDRIIAYWYEERGVPLPAYGVKAEQWKDLRHSLGWGMASTAALLIFIMAALFRRYRSWRWR